MANRDLLLQVRYGSQVLLYFALQRCNLPIRPLLVLLRHRHAAVGIHKLGIPLSKQRIGLVLRLGKLAYQLIDPRLQPLLLCVGASPHQQHIL